MTSSIYEFEGSGVAYLTYQWRSKLYLCKEPAFYMYARVRALSYDDLTLLVYGDGVLLDAITVLDDEAFTLTPPSNAYSKFWMELVGTDEVESFATSDDVAELF